MNKQKRPFREFAESLRRIKKERPSEEQVEKINKIIQDSDTQRDEVNYDEIKKIAKSSNEQGLQELH